MQRVAVLLLLVCGWLGAFPLSEARAAGADGTVMVLPEPEKTGGMPLMDALARRKADRAFSDKPIAAQTLSDLLWATWGINRPDGRRTAPSSRNSQAICVYVAMQTGVWVYEAEKNALRRVLDADTRSAFGGAPLTLLYAAPAADAAGGMHAGSLYQNAGLFCASVGLANVVKTTGIHALDGRLELPDGYRVYVVQSIGWPR